MRRLNVMLTSFKEVEEKWQMKLPIKYVFNILYIRCNAKLEINWNKAPLYTLSELLEKKNIIIVYHKRKINNKS